MKKLPHWLVPVLAALSPATIAISTSAPLVWQGPISVLGIVMAGLSGMVMPAPSWAVLAHPVIPTGMVGVATVAAALLKQLADQSPGGVRVAYYAAACAITWAAGLNAPSPISSPPALQAPANPQPGAGK
jgi:hypothetical protein